MTYILIIIVASLFFDPSPSDSKTQERQKHKKGSHEEGLLQRIKGFLKQITL